MTPVGVVSILDDLAAQVHLNSVEHGFHDKPWEIWFPEQMMNIVGEVAELNEAHRTDSLFKACDKADNMAAQGIPAMSCIEEELADIIIRALDMYERTRSYNHKVSSTAMMTVGMAVLTKHKFNKTRERMHGKTS